MCMASATAMAVSTIKVQLHEIAKKLTQRLLHGMIVLIAWAASVGVISLVRGMYIGCVCGQMRSR